VRAWLIPAALIASAAIAQPPRPVTIDAATMRRLGVVTAPARATAHTSAVSGFARVLDPIPLAQLDSDIAAAAATATASAAEATRAEALFAKDATVSRKAAQAARAQAQGDAARLALLRRRLGFEWGPAILRLSDAQRGALVQALATGHAALLRIDSAGGEGQAGLRTVTIDLGELGTVVATIIGPARAADPRLQSPGLIARASGAKASLLSTGLTVPANIHAVARSGTFVPATAILRIDGASWAYVMIRPGTFTRRKLEGALPTTGGLFATGGIRAGEAIVTGGGSALYAAEHGSGPAE